MTMYVVDVAVALSRPPLEDRWARYVLDAKDETEALVEALWWANRGRGVVMPVRAEVAGRLDGQPDPTAVTDLVERLRSKTVMLRSQ